MDSLVRSILESWPQPALRENPNSILLISFSMHHGKSMLVSKVRFQ